MDGAMRRMRVPTPRELSARGATRYSRPREVACMSISATRAVAANSRAALRPCSVLSGAVDASDKATHEIPRLADADLWRGYGAVSFVQKDDGRDEHIDAILLVTGLAGGRAEGAQKHDSVPGGGEGDAGDTPASLFGAERPFPDVIAWRGMLVRLFCTPYAGDAWEMHVQRGPGGALCIEESHAFKMQGCERGAKRPRPSHRGGPDARLAYGGHRFEQMCTGDVDAHGEPAAVDCRVEYDAVFEASLGPHRLLFGAEMDCYLSEGNGAEGNGAAGNSAAGNIVEGVGAGGNGLEGKSVRGNGAEGNGTAGNGAACPAPGTALRYVELKTALLRDGRRPPPEDPRYMRWWAQSFLAGVETLVVGWRRDARSGHLAAATVLPVASVARAARGRAPWDAQAVLRWGDDVLAWLRESVPAGCTRCHVLAHEDGVLTLSPRADYSFV